MHGVRFNGLGGPKGKMPSLDGRWEESISQSTHYRQLDLLLEGAVELSDLEDFTFVRAVRLCAMVVTVCSAAITELGMRPQRRRGTPSPRIECGWLT